MIDWSSIDIHKVCSKLQALFGLFLSFSVAILDCESAFFHIERVECGLWTKGKSSVTVLRNFGGIRVSLGESAAGDVVGMLLCSVSAIGDWTLRSTG